MPWSSQASRSCSSHLNGPLRGPGHDMIWVLSCKERRGTEAKGGKATVPKIWLRFAYSFPSLLGGQQSPILSKGLRLAEREFLTPKTQLPPFPIPTPHTHWIGHMARHFNPSTYHQAKSSPPGPKAKGSVLSLHTVVVRAPQSPWEDSPFRYFPSTQVSDLRDRAIQVPHCSRSLERSKELPRISSQGQNPRLLWVDATGHGVSWSPGVRATSASSFFHVHPAPHLRKTT